MSVSCLNVLHSLHFKFLSVSPKNHNLYTLLKIIGLAAHTLSWVCSNFSVIIHIEQTNQMPPPSKAPLSPSSNQLKLQNQRLC